jgi:hypothetical protein
MQLLYAAVILAEGEERYVKAEDLVIVRNRNGNEMRRRGRNIQEITCLDDVPKLARSS